MIFLHPEILYGLILLVIPVIIHLFHFKKFKPVYFSQIVFLKELKKESNTKNKLKKWLLLFTRVIAISCLIISFASPFLPEENSEPRTANSISIFIDNSFSTEAENEQGVILELEKNLAREIISSFPESDEFQILHNSLERKNLRFYNKETALQFIDNIKPSTESIDLVKLRNIQKNSNKLHAKHALSSFLLSDFQKSQFNLKELSIIDNEKIFLCPIENQQRKNISISDALLTKPNFQQSGQIELAVTLQNHSEEIYEGLNIKLTNQNKVKASRTVNLLSNDSLIVNFHFTPDTNDYQEIIIQINDAPIGFDNKFHLTIPKQANPKVAYIHKENHSYFSKLFNTKEFDFESISENKIPYNNLQEFDLIILDELIEFNSGLIASLEKAFKGSSNICIIPAENPKLSNYNNLLSALGQGARLKGKKISNLEITDLNFDHPIYKDVFKSVSKELNKPSTKHNFPIFLSEINKGKTILKLQNDDPFLWSGTSNGNYCFLLSTDLSKGSNLNDHALFVPTFYNMSFLKDNMTKLQYTIGKEQRIRLKKSDSSDKISLHFMDKTYYPTFKQMESGLFIELGPEFKEEGIYNLVQNKHIIGKLGFNYSRKESELKYYELEELEKYISNQKGNSIQIIDQTKESMVKELTQQFTGKILWPYFLALSLLFLIFEIALIKIRPYENSNS